MKNLETKELQNLQELNSNFVKLKTQLGDLELQKQLVIEQVSFIKSDFADLEKSLIKKYGENSVINLQSGEITEKETEK
jgi:hypothetical protein|tara:strand:- start:1241 stop:1477 length:237 start_codon:yes stop_codon:yes gene_type:complete